MREPRHEPDRWPEFCRRYHAELATNPLVDDLREALAAGPLTLLYSARDVEHNQAVALGAFLSGEAPSG